MSNKEYFVAKLKTGIELDFDKQCNNMDYSDEHYAVFSHEFNSAKRKVLAVVPHSIIEMIINKED